jgi:cyclophilin family peptidyl-prolyl cis-trans isomerase
VPAIGWATTLLVGVLGISGVAGAATAPATSRPTDELITASQALQSGFTKVVQAAGVSTSTGVAGCATAAEEAFENKAATTGLVSEAYFCNTASSAVALMKGIARSGSALSGVAVPRSLGAGAMARQSGTANYGIFWRHGTVVEIAAVDTGLGSSKNKRSKALTAGLRTLLVATAKVQNGRFVTPPPTATQTAQSAADSAAVAGGCQSNPSATLHKDSWKTAPAQTVDATKSYTATVQTDAGTFVISLDPRSAPISVNNFVFLAQHGFFNCVTFHRVIPGFVDQTGDPTGTGTGGPGYTIADEFPPTAADTTQQYPLGSVAMANTGKADSGGSQWFVVTGAQGESLPPKYSLFGQVTSGMSVVQAINAQGTTSGAPAVVHRILTVTITTAPG